MDYFAYVTDTKGMTFGLSLRTRDEAWLQETISKAERISSADLFQSTPVDPRHVAPTRLAFYPETCVPELTLLGRDVFRIDGDGNQYSGDVFSLRGSVKLTRGDGSVLVRDMVEVHFHEFATATKGVLSTEDQGNQFTRRRQPLISSSAFGNLVIADVAVQEGTEFRREALGLVVAGYDKRVIVAPLAPYLKKHDYALLKPHQVSSIPSNPMLEKTAWLINRMEKGSRMLEPELGIFDQEILA